MRAGTAAFNSRQSNANFDRKPTKIHRAKRRYNREGFSFYAKSPKRSPTQISNGHRDGNPGRSTSKDRSRHGRFRVLIYVSRQ
jgi:hypothetical protein